MVTYESGKLMLITSVSEGSTPISGLNVTVSIMDLDTGLWFNGVNFTSTKTPLTMIYDTTLQVYILQDTDLKKEGLYVAVYECNDSTYGFYRTEQFRISNVEQKIENTEKMLYENFSLTNQVIKKLGDNITHYSNQWIEQDRYIAYGNYTFDINRVGLVAYKEIINSQDVIVLSTIDDFVNKQVSNLQYDNHTKIQVIINNEQLKDRLSLSEDINILSIKWLDLNKLLLVFKTISYYYVIVISIEGKILFIRKYYTSDYDNVAISSVKGIVSTSKFIEGENYFVVFRRYIPTGETKIDIFKNDYEYPLVFQKTSNIDLQSSDFLNNRVAITLELDEINKEYIFYIFYPNLVNSVPSIIQAACTISFDFSTQNWVEQTLVTNLASTNIYLTTDDAGRFWYTSNGNAYCFDKSTTFLYQLKFILTENNYSSTDLQEISVGAGYVLVYDYDNGFVLYWRDRKFSYKPNIDDIINSVNNKSIYYKEDSLAGDGRIFNLRNKSDYIGIPYYKLAINRKDGNDIVSEQVHPLHPYMASFNGIGPVVNEYVTVLSYDYEHSKIIKDRLYTVDLSLSKIKVQKDSIRSLEQLSLLKETDFITYDIGYTIVGELVDFWKVGEIIYNLYGNNKLMSYDLSNNVVISDIVINNCPNLSKGTYFSTTQEYMFCSLNNDNTGSIWKIDASGNVNKEADISVQLDPNVTKWSSLKIISAIPLGYENNGNFGIALFVNAKFSDDNNYYEILQIASFENWTYTVQRFYDAFAPSDDYRFTRNLLLKNNNDINTHASKGGYEYDGIIYFAIEASPGLGIVGTFSDGKFKVNDISYDQSICPRVFPHMIRSLGFHEDANHVVITSYIPWILSVGFITLPHPLQFLDDTYWYGMDINDGILYADYELQSGDWLNIQTRSMVNTSKAIVDTASENTLNQHDQDIKTLINLINNESTKIRKVLTNKKTLLKVSNNQFEETVYDDDKTTPYLVSIIKKVDESTQTREPQ